MFRSNTKLKRTIGILLVALMMVSIIGCGTGQDNDKSDGEIDTSKEQDTVKGKDKDEKPRDDDSKNDQPGEVTLSLGLPGGYGITDEEIVNSFKDKYPNITLDIDEAPWGDFVEKITTQIAGGNAPDIWFQENAAVLGYGHKGAAEDLIPYITENLDRDEFIDALFAAQDGEKVWGIPHGINPIALAYNKKIFEDAGEPFPTDDWTYEEMIEVAKRLTKGEDADGNREIYGFYSMANITQGWFPWIKSTGGQALDPTLTKAVFDEDPKTVEAITMWADLANKDKISPTRTFVEGLGGEAQVFGNNRAAMYFMQYSVAGAILNENFPDIDYDTVMIPKASDGNRYVPMVVNDWVIFSKAKQEAKDAAWLWIEHYLSEESQDIIAESGAALPVRKSSLEKLNAMTDTKPANKRAFTDGIAEAGITMDETFDWNEWRGAAQPIFTDIYDGLISPEEGLKEIRIKVQDVLDENR